MTRIAEVRVALHRPQGSFLPVIGDIGLLTVVTESGVTGSTFVSGAGSKPELVVRALAEVVRPQLIGLDALDTGSIWQRLWAQHSAIGSVAVGAVDTVLWDILGKVAGLPIHRLLGTARTSVPAYLSSWLHERPEDYVAEALHYRELGYTAYKLHPPTMLRLFGGRDIPLSADIATARAVREAVPDMVLMSDSFAYTYEEALAFGRVLEDLDFLWYEDPLPPDDIYGYERLRKQLRIPLMATERTEGGPYDYAQWIRSEATDYLRGDVFYKGGITPLMKIARTAEVFRLGFEPHDGFNSTGNLAQAHVTMASPNTNWFEVLAIHATGDYNLDWLNYGLTEPLRIENGVLHAPTRPGLGGEIDWDLINGSILAEL